MHHRSQGITLRSALVYSTLLSIFLFGFISDKKILVVDQDQVQSTLEECYVLPTIAREIAKHRYMRILCMNTRFWLALVITVL